MIRKILHTADWHLNRTNHSKILSSGMNSKLADTLESIEQIDKIIDEQEIEIVVIAGDFFQIPKPSPDYISKVIEILWRWESKISCLIAISGNHDASPSARYNALQPLKSTFKNVAHFHFIYDKEIEVISYEDINFVCFPHTNELRIKSSDSIEKALHSTETSIKDSTFNILVGHFPIDEAVHTVDESQLICSDLSFKKLEPIFDKFNLVLLGDIHKQQQLGKNCFYSGSIIQNTFNEQDEVKGVCVYNVDEVDKEFEFEFIPIICREYKTVVLEDIKDMNSYSPKDYTDKILRIRLKISDVEKMLNYDNQLKEYFNECFMVVPDFTFINQQGKVITEVTGTNLVQALQDWITETYKDEKQSDKFEFILSESVDILNYQIQNLEMKASNDT